MQNFTQKALMVVLTVFVLVGLFYGLSTPVKATATDKANVKVNVVPQDAPGGWVPDCNGTPADCGSSLQVQ